MLSHAKPHIRGDGGTVGSKVVDYRGKIVPSTSFEMGCVDNGFSK